MYGEFTHKVGSTTDITYDQAACLQLAQSQPEQAVRNAENYNLFLSEFF
jgi:Lysine-specific metallo-endopeptidase